MKILIIDDDIVDRKIIQRALKSSSDALHVIHESDCVSDGFALLSQECFDVVLLDYRMPENDGIEMVKELRSRPNLGNTAIIMISASEELAIALECIEAGAQDFITKSDITLSKLEKAIAYAKKRFEIEQRMHESYLTMKSMAEKDPLTGLSNRYYFSDLLESTIEANKDTQCDIALLALDLDNFKHVNDTMGHDAGDKVLLESVNRIKSCLHGHVGFARLGGDEFAIILNNLSCTRDISLIAKKVLDSFNTPFHIDGNKISCGVSIGVALSPTDSNEAKNLLKCADIAMYRSKSTGKNNVSFYQPHFQLEFKRCFDIQRETIQVLENDGFRLFYQPIFSREQSFPCGFEALIRWPESDTMYTPDEFIPIAEESRLISLIGQWVIKTSIKQLAIWQSEFNVDLTMSINISPVQLQDFELSSYLSRITQENNVKPCSIILEITETALIKDNKKITDILQKLSDLGYQIALDDFGMGFSSIAHLMAYPIDIVKLDKSMQTTNNSSAKHRETFEALALMLAKLKFIIVAEGVETSKQLNLCQMLNIDKLQGYLLGKPLNNKSSGELLATMKAKELIS